MYRKILVPLDGSKRSAAILPHVEELAKHFNSLVILLRVEEQPLMLERDEVVDLAKCHEAFNCRKKEAESYLMDRQKEFQKKGIEASISLAYGPVVKSILAAAEEVNADLIAIASHGLSGQPRSFYGSVAAGILQVVDRPLLLIRSRRVEA